MHRSCGDGTYHPPIDPLVDPLVDPLIDHLSHEQMLRDLGASPGSVSDERAKAVFDAVLRNGLPETQSGRVGRSHHVMTNAWMAGESNGNPIERKGRKGGSDEVPISRGDRLCWSLFLEAMVGDKYSLVHDSVITNYNII